MRRAPAKPVRACTLRNWCLVSHVTFEAPLHTSHLTVFTLHTAHSTLHSSPHCTLRTSHSTLFTLHTAPFAVNTSHFTLHTPHFTLHSPHFILHTPHFPVLLCTTKLGQSTSQYYFVLQSFHTSLPSTTLYYKTCTKHVPVLLCTTKLAQNTSQYYFALQSLQALPPHPPHRNDPSHTRRTHDNTRHATFMQPFQCDLPPQLQETHRTTHTGTTTRCKTHRRNNSRQKRPQPHPLHRRGTFHRRLQPLYTEKHKVSCSGFLPTT